MITRTVYAPALIYVPVLIETEEQAERVPAGSFIGMGDPVDSWVPLLHPEADDWRDLPVRVLVPVEAEEEHSEVAVAEGKFVGLSRLVTEWKKSA